MLQFNNQRWTVGECSLNVSLPFHAQTLPEAWWTLDVSAHPANSIHQRDDLRISIQPFFVPIRDWRELQDLEVSVDAAWQDAHEFVNEDGEVQWTEIEARWWPDRSINKAHYWIGDQFLLRFGSREHDHLIFELEGLLEAEEDYYCDPPTVSSEVPSEPRSPASLLLMGQIQFRTCEVEVPGQVRDPLAWAQEKAARALGFRSFRSSNVRNVGGHPEIPLHSWKVALTPSFSE